MDDNSKLLGPDGKPLSAKKGQPQPDPLIETRLNSAIDQLRQYNQHDLRKIGEEVFGPQLRFWKRLSLWAGILTVVAVIGGIWKVPDIIENRTTRFIEENLVGTALTNTIDNVLSNRAVPFVNARLAPLSNNIASLEKQLEQAANQFALAQESLSQSLEIQDLLVRAKGGSLAAYQRLKILQTNSSISESAVAAATEIGFFFQNWIREETVYQNLDPISQTPVTVAVDDAVALLRQPNATAERRMTAAFILRGFKKRNTVQPLIEVLATETNLYASTQMIRSLNEITGKKFHPLDIAGALKWWSASKDDTNFHSVYDGLEKFGASTVLKDRPPREIIQWMTDVVEREPGAIKSRSIRGFYLSNVDQWKEAEADFAEVEKHSPNYPHLFLYRGLALVQHGDLTNGILSLNRAFNEWPILAEAMRNRIAPAVATNSLLRWPTNIAPLQSPAK